MNYEAIRKNLKHVVPHPPMGGMPKVSGAVEFYKRNHNSQDNFKAILQLWRVLENSITDEDFSYDYSIYHWYD